MVRYGYLYALINKLIDITELSMFISSFNFLEQYRMCVVEPYSSQILFFTGGKNMIWEE